MTSVTSVTSVTTLTTVATMPNSRVLVSDTLNDAGLQSLECAPGGAPNARPGCRNANLALGSVMHNEDRPGVIGAVGSILARCEINVSRMQTALHESQALLLWNTDAAVREDRLNEVRAEPAARSVLVAKL